MKITVSLSKFRDAFKDYGREESFSYEGLEIIFDYLLEYEESTGEELELDVIAICGDFTEYDLDDVNNYYDEEFEDLEEAEEWLSGQVSVLGVTSDTIVFQTY